VVDRAFLAAIWMNVACHLVVSQSARLLDMPYVLAQIFKVGSYAIVLAAALLDNARLFDQVRQLAVTDPLTGLSNYRTLINVMDGELQRSRRTGRPFAILLLDLDGLTIVTAIWWAAAQFAGWPMCCARTRAPWIPPRATAETNLP
jgi:predicted signal transduction protein with EAL and GGDEF domain